MALPDSGVLSLDDIQTEFGGTNPISMSEYYRGGSFVTNNNTDIPTSGEISFSDFYGGVKEFTLTISSNTQEADVRTLAVSAGWDETLPLGVVVDTGVYVWSDDVANGGLIVAGSFPSGITILNKGYIMGKGGYGAYPQGPLNTPAQRDAQAGGPAVQITSSSTVDITNNSGAYIAGGGGGGGRGNGCGGNGAGYSGTPGSSSYPAYASGSPSVIYCPASGTYGTVSGTGGQHGQAGGGSGGYGTWSAPGCNNYTVPLYGGDGGRVLPGLGGGDGGGSGGAASGNGGGNWGAAGAGTGSAAGGAAISGTYNSYTDNGTTYGTT